MIEAAIYALLMASPGVTSLVGTRIKPQGAPEVQGSAYPHLTYRKVANTPVTRTNLGRVNLWRARVQVDVWGRTELEAAQVAQAVVLVLDPSRAPGEPTTDLYVMAGCTVHTGEVVQGPIPFDETGLPLPAAPTSRAQRAQTDFAFHYTLT